jgi:hypothetical protein
MLLQPLSLEEMPFQRLSLEQMLLEQISLQTLSSFKQMVLDQTSLHQMPLEQKILNKCNLHKILYATYHIRRSDAKHNGISFTLNRLPLLYCYAERRYVECR